MDELFNNEVNSFTQYVKQTKRILKEKGIVSPPIDNLVKIDDKTWVQRPKGLHDKDLNSCIESKKRLYSIK